MGDVFAVADLLIDDLKNNHCDEVDLVAYYGSHAQGVASEHSDLNFFTCRRLAAVPLLRAAFYWTVDSFIFGRLVGRL
ncbi:MAG: hypothetical protein ACKVJG_03290 [Candidatus Latescibacterota bacterium]|jgi:hypothetical protein|tara:strand:- start:179 stop:412 length:234 start_codon:yes stop_codon:yes gene_type:complete